MTDIATVGQQRTPVDERRSPAASARATEAVGLVGAKVTLPVGAAAGGLVARFVDVLDGVFEDQQVRAAVAGELDAIAIVPLDGSLQHLAIGEHDGHRCSRLHLLNKVELLGVRLFRRRGLLSRLGSRREGFFASAGAYRGSHQFPVQGPAPWSPLSGVENVSVVPAAPVR